jgi:nucleotide-binding universal stress UspA family protein
MYRTVLVPTDGSIGAERGVEVGLGLAEQFDATVHALYVVDERRYGETPALSETELRFEQLEEAGEAVLTDVAQQAETLGLDVETTLRRGYPYEVIAAHPDEHDADVIVMGRHGASARPAPHIGSCTDRVLRLAPVPVLPV